VPTTQRIVKCTDRNATGNATHAQCHSVVYRKLKLSRCLTKHHAMKMWWGGGIAPRFLDLSTGSTWVVSFVHQPLYPRGKSPRYSLDRRVWRLMCRILCSMWNVNLKLVSFETFPAGDLNAVTAWTKSATRSVYRDSVWAEVGTTWERNWSVRGKWRNWRFQWLLDKWGATLRRFAGEHLPVVNRKHLAACGRQNIRFRKFHLPEVDRHVSRLCTFCQKL
jgi:hypothetical protein